MRQKIIKSRLKIEKKLIILMFSLIAIAILFFVFKMIIVSYVVFALWFLVLIYSIIYGEKTEEVIYDV